MLIQVSLGQDNGLLFWNFVSFSSVCFHSHHVLALSLTSATISIQENINFSYAFRVFFMRVSLLCLKS